MKKLTHGSLFDGFGGLRRGIEDAGFITKWSRDIIYGQDICTDDPRELQRVTLLSAGPACQRSSYAAHLHRQKTNETLYPHLLRFVSHLRAAWLVIEQPASVDRDLITSWCRDLERIGYGIAGRIIDSQHWVPQRRARWFIVGQLGSTGLAVWDHLYLDSFRTQGQFREACEGLRFDGNCPECVRGGIFAGISQRRIALMGAGNAVTQPLARWLAERIRIAILAESGQLKVRHHAIPPKSR